MSIVESTAQNEPIVYAHESAPTSTMHTHATYSYSVCGAMSPYPTLVSVYLGFGFL